MGKLTTPEWITEGFDSKADWEKSQGKKVSTKKSGKTFKIRKCPKCGSNNVAVVLTGEEGRGFQGWECKKCKWTGKNIDIEEVGEDEFLKMGEVK
jgi:transposase-like protein